MDTVHQITKRPVHFTLSGHAAKAGKRLAVPFVNDTPDVILRALLVKRGLLDKVELVVRQANTTDKIDVASLQQSYLELLEEKNRRIGEMAAQLKRYRVTNVEVDDISREVGAMTTNVRAISLMKGITFDVSGAPLDTTLVCVVTPKVASDSIDRTTLANWLRIRTKVANVKLFVEP